MFWKQITIQLKRYTYTIQILEALRLQSVRYSYTTYNFQANNSSIKMLHLHNLWFASLKIIIGTLHLRNLFSGLNIKSTTLHLHNLQFATTQ